MFRTNLLIGLVVDLDLSDDQYDELGRIHESYSQKLQDLRAKMGEKGTGPF